MNACSCYSAFLSASDVSSSDFGHSDRRVLVSSYFNLHLPDDTQWSIFSYADLLFVDLPWCNVSSSLLPIFLIRLFIFFGLGCRSFMYILDNNPLSDRSLGNIFSQ